MFDIFSKYERYRQYKQTVKELNNMTDRDLFDIGIHRTEIRSVARECAKK